MTRVPERKKSWWLNCCSCCSSRRGEDVEEYTRAPGDRNAGVDNESGGHRDGSQPGRDGDRPGTALDDLPTVTPGEDFLQLTACLWLDFLQMCSVAQTMHI